MAEADDDWPALRGRDWSPTKRTIHLTAQMLGKLRLALSPHQPNFTFTALSMTPRGLTTGAIPVGRRTIDAEVDVLDQRIRLRSSDGARCDVPLATHFTIGQVYAAYLEALDVLDVAVTLSPVPQEIPDTTPFDRDERAATCDPADARLWLAVMSAAQGAFDRWRAHFFGRTALHVWWGGFDLALMLFSGKHVAPPLDRGYLFKYDLDAELVEAGLYPGDAANEAFFFGYVHPQPPNAGPDAPHPPGAEWSSTFGEWTLPYETMRTAADPDASVAAFLTFIYELAGWDRSLYSYTPPPLRRAP